MFSSYDCRPPDIGCAMSPAKRDRRFKRLQVDESIYDDAMVVVKFLEDTGHERSSDVDWLPICTILCLNHANFSSRKLRNGTAVEASIIMSKFTCGLKRRKFD